MSRFSRRTLAALALAATLAAAPAPVFAQTPGQVVAAVPAGLDQRRAEELRQEFRELMRRYPPALAEILRLDPSLLNNPDYVAPYAALVAYLQAHLEIGRHPEYFLEFANRGNWWSDPASPEVELRREAINLQRSMFENLTIVAAISVVVYGIIWLVRTFLGHRRWIRTTRLQAELNNRLLERMGSSEQLVAYLQSQAGRDLTAVPAEAAAAAPAIAAPFSRILWAVQAGIVLVSGGIGMLVIRRNVIEEAGEALFTLGVLAIAIGVGFALAAAASYLLSRRLGLLEPPREGALANRS
jgi:succinate dehydrogenase hydrophobic anchor subunit